MDTEWVGIRYNKTALKKKKVEHAKGKKGVLCATKPLLFEKEPFKS